MTVFFLVLIREIENIMWGHQTEFLDLVHSNGFLKMEDGAMSIYVVSEAQHGSHNLEAASRPE